MFSCVLYKDYVFQLLFAGRERPIFVNFLFLVQQKKKGSPAVVRDQDCFRQARALELLLKLNQ